MSCYTISYLKTKLGYFTLESDSQSIVGFYPSNKEKVEINKNSIHRSFSININKYLSRKVTTLKYKLNPKGTFFQKLVWKELINIKYGTTTTDGLHNIIFG